MINYYRRQVNIDDLQKYYYEGWRFVDKLEEARFIMQQQYDRYE